MSLLIATMALGLIFAILALGVYLSFRVYQIPDMTADGSFPLGAAVTARMLKEGSDPVTATATGVAAGAAAGVITGIIRNFDLCAPDQRPGPTPQRPNAPTPPHTRRHHAHPHFTSAGLTRAPVRRVSHCPTTSFAPRARIWQDGPYRN